MSSKVLHYCICQPRSKPDRVPTEDYCFNHRRFVCDNCICDEINNRHVNCIVGNYSDWLHSKNRKHSISLKSENKCPLCNDVLNDNPMQVIRIGCKCVYHSKCLREYILFNKNENMDDILCVECGQSMSNSYILTGNTNLAKQTRKFLTLIGKEKKSLLSNANSKNEYLKLQDKNRFANVRYESKRNENDLSNNNDNSNNVNDNGLSLHNNNDEFDRNFDNFENGARESENERETERERHMHDNNDSHNHNDSVIETQSSINNTLNMNNFNNSNNEAQASAQSSGQAPSVVVDTMPSVPRTRHTHAHSQRHSDTNGTGYGASQTGLHGGSSVRRMSRINRPLHRSKQSGFFGGRLPKQQTYTVLLILAVLLQIVFLYMIFANNNDPNSANSGNSGSNNVNLNTIDKSQLADILGQARMEKLNLKNKMIP